MNKLISLLLAVTLPFFAFEMNAEEMEVKQIPLERRADKRLERTIFIISVESYYNGMLSAVITTFPEDVGEVTLVVTNFSTGEVFSDCLDSGAVTQSLTLISGSPGYYQVLYLTEGGDVYEGYFEI